MRYGNITYISAQNPNTIWAGPSSGSAASPSFRTLLPSDIPGIDASKIISGILPVIYGGTGAVTPNAARASLGISSPSQNALINGSFAVAQRGTSFSFSGSATANTFVPTYTLDRWQYFYNVGSGTTTATVTVSQQAPNPGDIPGEPANFLRIQNTDQGNTGTNSYHAIAQSIEGVRFGAGSSITLSFYARCSYSKSVYIQFSQIFGSGGASTPSATVYFGGTAITLTSTWQKYTITAAVPTITGKTIGTNKDDVVRLEIDLQSTYIPLSWGGTGTTDFAQVQLEAGVLATDFAFRPLAMEYLLCQRYFQYAYGLVRFLSTGANAQVEMPIHFSLMRTVPSVSAVSIGTHVNVASTAINNITNNSAGFLVTATASGDCQALGDKYALYSEY